MTNVMEALYREWAENEINVSPELERAIEKYGNDNEFYFEIDSAVAEKQRLAFSAGFRTAVQLLIRGMQS